MYNPYPYDLPYDKQPVEVNLYFSVIATGSAKSQRNDQVQPPTQEVHRYHSKKSEYSKNLDNISPILHMHTNKALLIRLRSASSVSMKILSWKDPRSI